jgi:hypothetical protein
MRLYGAKCLILVFCASQRLYRLHRHLPLYVDSELTIGVDF